MDQKEKTREELLSAKWEDLNMEEKVLKSSMERFPDLTLEKAKEYLYSIL